MSGVLAAALAWHQGGACVIRAQADGTKAPIGARGAKWTQYQHQRPDLDDLHHWFAGGHPGLGLVCGAVSGQLEMLELEGRAIAERAWPTIAALAGADPSTAATWHLVTGSTQAYVEQTPSGGVHILYRIADGPVPGNTKLAQRPARDDELTPDERDLLARKPDKVVARVLAETRGEGGFVVAAPSHGPTHETGRPWSVLIGQPGQVPTITLAQREALHTVFRALDRMPAPPQPRPASSPAPAATGDQTPGSRPGDAYNTAVSWGQVLEPHGWREHYRSDDGITYWTRPGKSSGVSASTNSVGTDTLHVFTTSTEFDGDSWHDKFGAYAILNHHGDHAAAAAELARAGFGDPVDWAKAQRDDITTILGRPDWHPAASTHDASFVPAAAAPSLLTAPTMLNPSAVPAERPRLEILGVAEMAEWLRDNLGRGPLAGMLLRGTDVVHTPRQGETGYIPPDDDEDNGPNQVRRVDVTALRSRIQYRYRCEKFDVDSKRWKPTTFPGDAAALALGAPDEMRHLQRLEGVTHVPLIRPDGTLLEPGYDPVTQLLYLPEQPISAGTISLADAVAQVRYPLTDFRWSGKHDEANFIGLMLTPLLRLLTPPPYKLAVISAHQPGSGKSLLAGVLRTLHGGVFRAEVPEDEPEWRKQVTSILDVTTGPVVQLDNVTGTLRSGTLSGLLTSARWDDRRLGGNNMVHAANDRLWVVTGNNASLGGDLLRRSVWVTIDPGIPDPHLRNDFTIPDLLRWVEAHRAPLIRALITLVQTWIAEGSPTEVARADSYGRWISAVRGILAVAGIPGTFDHEESAQQTTGEDDQEWSEFLGAIHATFADSTWTVAKLLDHVNGPGKRTSLLDEIGTTFIPLDALPAALVDRISRAGTVTAINKSLGRWLAHRTGRWAGGRCVRNVGMDREQKKEWRVETWAR